MVKKSSKKQQDVVEITPQNEIESEIVPPSVVEVVSPSPATESKKKKKSKKESVPVTEESVVSEEKESEVVVTEEVVKSEEQEEITQDDQETKTPKKRERKTIKKEDLARDLELLTKDLLQEVTEKELVKRIKTFKANIVKILKLKLVGEKKERDTSNSGFMKPVNVTEKMRQFLKLGENEVTRRLDITKKICDYIKEHDLQDPKDRRNILVDELLGDLLNIQKTDPPLTYYSIQQKLKDHIIKI